MALEATRDAIIRRLREMMEAHPYNGSTEGYYSIDDALEQLYNEVGTDKQFVGQLLANNELFLDVVDLEFSRRDGDSPNDSFIRGIFMLIVGVIIGSDARLNEEEHDRNVAFSRAQSAS